MLFKRWMNNDNDDRSYEDKLSDIKELTATADAIVIGAGAGLSTSAGFTYNGERFDKYFSDFKGKYKFTDMYSGGFYPYQTLEEHWAFWSRYIYINRYMNAPKPVYDNLYELVKAKDYFVITTNVDHCFQKAGFDKHRLYYTQGDYGLFQCSEPCHKKTYDNEDTIRKMVMAQGYEFKQDGSLYLPEGRTLKMAVPSELVPYCPECGKPMSMNLRADNTFVEDEGWHVAAQRYEQFLERHKELNVVFIELGIGYNTPVIIKYPFWQMTDKWSHAHYICLNYGQACAPDEIKEKSVCVNKDIDEVIRRLL
ncbi:MAG: Sir2 silent information regulator family NAD-dependent deacetylase [Eubacteriales bacterium]|nr:Sir2 silent information regulator family NAD-dependent deacetylase [Eubacteriales bacterium]